VPASVAAPTKMGTARFQEETVADLTLDPTALDAGAAYHVLNSLVVPRPIAWVSTRSASGVANLAPHSYFTVLAPDPPTICFSSGGEKDTLRNVRFGGDFVVNVVGEELAEAMNLTAADFPPDESEFRVAGLTPIPSDLVGAPRLAEAPAAMECRLLHVLEVGRTPNYVVIGEVMRFHIAESVWRDGRVDLAALRPVGRLAGSGYSYTRELFRMERPTYAGLRDAGLMPRP
jgi:flavin reductase (DIM6/NTAB) family NADH-FMN oxidoreductase RutF